MSLGMKNRDSYDAITSLFAIIADLAVIWLGQMVAVWIRFDSGWFALDESIRSLLTNPEAQLRLYGFYSRASFVALVIYLTIFQLLKLYIRPQDGTFSAKIPRIVRACIFGGCGVLIASGLLKNTLPFISNGVVLLSMATVTFFVLLERLLLFRLEVKVASKSKPCHRAVILGTGEDAVRYIKAIESEPRMRTQIAAILTVGDEPVASGIPAHLLRGDRAKLEEVVDSEQIDMLVLATHSLTHDETVSLVVFCERHLVRFNMIPDLFRMMTTRMEFQMIDNVPLVGIGRWPLDQVWNRMLKRVVDIIGSIIGLLISLPFVLIAAIVIKCESKGPIFYGQERCGRRGKTFTIYKLRTMKQDAESGGKPGWTVGDDPRRTRSGAFLRKWNIDELPQFWNVLKGEMSLVGPRPERPYFVEQFTPGVEHYMWRHVSKPGLTGWAQVNGLRGDTSISERVKFDLYYLENWSLAFDFKILVRTFFAYRNAG